MSAVKQMLNELLKPLLRIAQVERVTEVSKRFRRIELSGVAFKTRCDPGDKLQILTGADFRTYSPFAFDASAGRLSILAFIHGDAPGARWAHEARPGDVVHVFGPRGSLSLRSFSTPVVMVGDETSIGVGRALQEVHASSRCVFEVTDELAARTAAEAIGLRDTTFVTRLPEEAHLEAVWKAASVATQPQGSLVLTGKASTIQTMRSLARRDGFTNVTQKTKTYWAPGKRGLD